MDARTLGLIGGVLVVLGVSTAIMYYLKRRTEHGIDPAIVETFRSRVLAWWVLFACLGGAILGHKSIAILLFMGISFWALREFITLTPTRPADHRTLFWVLFLCPPLQCLLVGLDPEWLTSKTGLGNYEFFSIMIPVYVALIVPVRIALSGDPKRFLERTAKIQMGVLICVYFLSYAPALLTMHVPDQTRAAVEQQAEETLAEEAKPKVLEEAAPSNVDEKVVAYSPGARLVTRTPKDNATQEDAGAKDDEKTAEVDAPAPVVAAEPPVVWTKYTRPRLLFFFILMVQLGDAFTYVWSQLPSKHPLAPKINPTRTWEGVLGGAATTALCGGVLYWATPYPYWWQAVLISAVVALMGVGGSLTMSAIKRDRGVSDYGTLVEGHSGVLDRIDSICFAAPVFYHMTYLFVS